MLRVEEVRRADQRRRFVEVGRVLFAGEPRWAAPLRSYEDWLFSRRHPYRRTMGGEVARFLVRRDGTVVGRACAHTVPGSAEGWFGAFECNDDVDAVRALLDASGEWVAERGAASLTGPATFTPADDAGILVAGFDHAGGTGRPWHPPWYASHLVAAGLEPVGEPMPRWRLSTGGPGTMPVGGPRPPHAGRLVDPELVLSGPAGDVAAVPDVSAVARAVSLRAARSIQPTEAAVVRSDGDPAVLIPAIRAAAHRYDALWAPWSPDPSAPPDTVHRLFGRPP